MGLNQNHLSQKTPTTETFATSQLRTQTMGDCVNALKRWTGKASATIVFDSTVDEFTDDGLFNTVCNKWDIAIIATTQDGDVFGGFYNVAVTEHDRSFADPNQFAFSFEAHGRCETPQMFPVKREKQHLADIILPKDDEEGVFVQFGTPFQNFGLGNESSETYCYDLADCFCGLQSSTLSGRDGVFGTHHCTRLVAVHLW